MLVQKRSADRKRILEKRVMLKIHEEAILREQKA